MRTPITNKINPETNFIVFPTFSPYQLLSLYYLILINILKTIYKVNGKNRKNLRKKEKSNTFLKNSNINIVKNPMFNW